MTIQKEKPADVTNVLFENVSRRHLVNILNYVNFREKSVVVNLRRSRGAGKISLRAIPEPCSGENARLIWSEEPPTDIDTGYIFTDFLIDWGQRVVIVEGQLTDIDRAAIAVLLPEHCRATLRRRTERFGSAPVQVTLMRNKSETKGFLQDFSRGFLKVRVAARKADFLSKKENKLPLRVSLQRGETKIYDGKALIERYRARRDDIDLVLALVPSVEDRASESREVSLSPTLVATYRHPLSNRIIRLDVLKASYNTFVIKEDPRHAALLVGLIVPEIYIDFGTGDSAKCSARVVADEGGAWSLSIVDMPVLDQRKLFSFLEKETGVSSGVSNVIDPEDLIEFFFEAGFIYPEKYTSLARSRDRLREILSRLYVDTPSISQHFVQYNRGLIEGHICMVRFYERAWVVHHHTAIGHAQAGSAVLAQIFRYIYSYGHLPSTGMNYAMTYYRPENRFPDRVLGGLARSLNTPSLCSIDPFAYLHLRFEGKAGKGRKEKAWQLGPVSREDLIEIETFYQSESGGLTLKAFGLDSAWCGRETVDLDAEFEKAGLRRRKSFFSLRLRGKLKAVMMASDSNAGLNMSGLMKCIHVFVVDKEELPFDALISQLGRLSSLYDEQEIPVLLFPVSYMDEQKAPYEKIYDLLVFHISVGKRFIEFLERMTDRTARRKYRELSPDRKGETREQ